MRRDRLFGIILVWLMFPLSSLAQQDDMYFVPQKEKKEVKKPLQKNDTPNKEQVADSVVTRSPGYSFSYEEPYSAGERDVDEYNRRYRLVDTTAASKTTAEKSSAEESSADDRGWVNGFEGSEEDYACARRILLFCSPSVGIPVSSPLYWDLCYGPSSIYWNVYNDGFYAYAFPSYWNSLYYAPWDVGYWWTFRYSSPYWGFGFGWGYPYYGWGYPYWHHYPHYHHNPHYAWNMHSTNRVGRPAVGRPVSGRPGLSVSDRGARVNRSYTTSDRGARTSTRVNSTNSNRKPVTTRSQNRANRSYQSTTTNRVSPSNTGVSRSSGTTIRQSTGGVSRGARVSGGGVSRGRR